MPRTTVVVVAGLLLAAVGCATVVPSASPSASAASAADVGRFALDRVVAHDLLGATPFVCPRQRNARDLPFPISGLFGPLGELPSFDVPSMLRVTEIDASEVRIEPIPSAANPRAVRVAGVLALDYDSAVVEALFRSMAMEAGVALDEGALARTVRKVSAAPIRLPIDETVPVTREGGQWYVCPADPTP